LAATLATDAAEVEQEASQHHLRFQLKRQHGKVQQEVGASCAPAF